MRFTLSHGLRIGAALAVAALVATNGGVRAAVQGAVSGIDAASLDPTCKPCTDFYQFANGGWIKNHPIPAAYPSYGSFNTLVEQNRDVLHTILEQAAVANAPAGSNEQKIGDYYASCMDTATIEKAGTAPLDPLFKTVESINGEKSVAPALAQLQLEGVDAFFSFGSGPDFKNSAQDIAQLDQAGLGLPDRDYYFKDDAKSKAIRDAYVVHVTKMFVLLGESNDKAAADAQTVMTVETALAKNSLTRVQRRDPSAVYHKVTLADLAKTAPNFDWASYFSGSGVTPDAINVSEPDYFTAFSTNLAQWTPDQIKTYLRWHIVHGYATVLPQAFVDENFDFYSKTLQGTPQQLERWKRCVRATDGALGEALGQFYVAKVFPPSAKAQTLELVKYVKQTLRDDMGTLDWMSPATKAKAIEKLDAFTLKIGYPDTWRDYSNLTIVRSPYAQNAIASSIADTKRDYAKIGKPHDKLEWGMTPPTVNAYYDPTENDINFPAGILQPPFFDKNADMAVNFGGIGAVIGHESTHGFDDEGRQFDKNGNLSDWWTANDSANFDKRAQCIVDQFNALSPVPGVHENGQLVQGEAIADLGGLTIAYKAFEKWQASHPRRTIDGFTPEQRFFLGFAHVWASNQRPEYTRLLASVDPHPFDKFRVNATLSNMPQFAAAWGCKLPSPMVRPAKDRCQIW
jgi:putative endopeptidase